MTKLAPRGSLCSALTIFSPLGLFYVIFNKVFVLFVSCAALLMSAQTLLASHILKEKRGLCVSKNNETDSSLKILVIKSC